jgi:putative transcriptional regulator
MVPTSDLRLRNRVRDRRTELGLTVVDLAERAGVSRRVVGLIDREDATHVPSGTVQLKLARALGASVQDLFWSEPFEAVAS